MNRWILPLFALCTLVATPVWALVPGSLPDPIQGQILQTQTNYDAREDAHELRVVNFFSTTCVPCLREAGMYSKLAKELGSERIGFYYVNVEPNPNTLRLEHFLARLEAPVPMIMGDVAAIQKAYDANGLPKLVILNGRGQVLQSFIGYHPNLEEQLRRALAAEH